MPIDRSRNVDPRTAEIRLASAKRSPQTALPTLFTKPLAHTFASGATQHLGCRPSLRLMVRTYIRNRVAMAATAARLACLPATGRRRVAAPQQPQQWLRVAMAVTAARLACLPATGRRRVVVPQQPHSKGCSKSERIARGRGSKGGGHQPLEAVGQAQ